MAEDLEMLKSFVEFHTSDESLNDGKKITRRLVIYYNY